MSTKKIRNFKHEINSYHKLKKNWDHYGSDPPDIEDLERSIHLLEITDVQPVNIAPIPNGGVFFEFKTKKGFCEVMISDLDSFLFIEFENEIPKYKLGSLNMLLTELW